MASINFLAAARYVVERLPCPPQRLSAITSANAMSSSPSLAAPVPSTCVPAALMYQFMSPLLSSQRFAYFQNLSNEA